MDLGISSPQVDEAKRGFSFRLEAFLDMRMDQSSGITAAEVLNTFKEQDLVNIEFDYLARFSMKDKL